MVLVSWRHYCFFLLINDSTPHEDTYKDMRQQLVSNNNDGDGAFFSLAVLLQGSQSETPPCPLSSLPLYSLRL